MTTEMPSRGAVFWPIGTGDSTTIVIDDDSVMQIDLHDMAKADADDTPEVPVVDELVACLPLRDGKPYLAVFALTHADKDHCLGFADLLAKVTIRPALGNTALVARIRRGWRTGYLRRRARFSGRGGAAG